MDKERIDVLLVEQGHFPSREKAKAAIMAGQVFLGTERLEKSGMKIPRSASLSVKGAIHPYVSRGGLKLAAAIETFDLDLHNCVMMDIGASTGGFTDCALQHGAAYVYAIDVGYNQLDWSIRSDERVHVMERTNFRYLTREDLKGPTPSFATIDVSFISLRLIIPPLVQMLEPTSEIVALIKPQFEAGREQIGKSGVVRDATVHKEVILRTLHMADEYGLHLQGLTFSPITGSEGNIEFLAYWQYDKERLKQSDTYEVLVNDIIHQSRSLIK